MTMGSCLHLGRRELSSRGTAQAHTQLLDAQRLAPEDKRAVELSVTALFASGLPWLHCAPA